MKKRLGSILLVICMLLTMLPVGALAEGAKEFRDVTADDWYYDAVYELVDRGIVSGKSKTEFAPEASITREEIVKMLAVMEKLTIDGGESVFNDVRTNDWFFGYVNAAAKAGIVNEV